MMPEIWMVAKDTVKKYRCSGMKMCRSKTTFRCTLKKIEGTLVNTLNMRKVLGSISTKIILDFRLFEYESY